MGDRNVRAWPLGSQGMLHIAATGEAAHIRYQALIEKLAVTKTDGFLEKFLGVKGSTFLCYISLLSG